MVVVFRILRMLLPLLLFALVMHLFRRFLHSTASQGYWKGQRQTGNGSQRNGGRYQSSSGGRSQGGAGTKSRRDPYGVLGCSPGDSDEEIKRRYRQLIAKYHPDRFIGLELDEEFVRLASERFEEVKQAYEEIRSMRGLS